MTTIIQGQAEERDLVLMGARIQIKALLPYSQSSIFLDCSSDEKVDENKQIPILYQDLLMDFLSVNHCCNHKW